MEIYKCLLSSTYGKSHKSGDCQKTTEHLQINLIFKKEGVFLKEGLLYFIFEKNYEKFKSFNTF